MSTVTLDRLAPLRTPLRSAIRLTGLAGLSLVAVVVALRDVLAPVHFERTGAGPALMAPSAEFPFGTDLLGRGVLSETLHGLAVTLAQGLIAMAVTLAVGGLAGFLAARLPLKSGVLLRQLAAILGAVPPLMLAILLAGATGRSFAPYAAGLAAAPLAFARTYDRARRLGASRHAEYARATGIPGATLLRRDLVYDFQATFLSDAARALAAVIVISATVSFLGFGSAPPQSDLGLMISAALPNYLVAWWTAAFPALALLLTILFARLAAALDEGERP